MTKKPPDILSPRACFVIERVQSEGYKVTSAEGPDANKWKVRALALLDLLGQPDLKGPSEYFRWVGPIGPSGEYVGVSVKLTPNGEARYHQAWFHVPKPWVRRLLYVGLVFLAALVSFAAGLLAGSELFPRGPSNNSGPPMGNDPSAKSPADPPAKDSPLERWARELKKELSSTDSVRAKLKKFLSQEGFAADLSAPVIEERRSVRVIDDLDKPPPSEQEVRLSNIEVAKFLRLLKTLKEGETLEEGTTNPKSLTQPGGQ